MQVSNCKEWLEKAGFVIEDNITAKKGDVIVKFNETQLLSITVHMPDGNRQVILTLEELSIFIFIMKS